MFSSKNLRILKPYTLSSHRAWELTGDPDVLKLDWNEASIPPSPKVRENIIKFLENGNMQWYPDVNNAKLLNKLSKYIKLPVENIQYFASSDSLQEYIATAYIDDGDKVIIVSPTYDNFRSSMQSRGAIIEFYTLNDKFVLDIDDFKDAIATSSPKMVYICNPNNPTGTLYDKDILKDLICSFKNILFIIDEAYCEFGGDSCKDLVLEYNNLLINRTFSKAFALASFRIGYVLASKNNIEILSKIRNPKNINTFSQIAAISALDDLKYTLDYVNEVIEAKRYFKEELLKLNLEVFGDGGNFLLVKISADFKNEFIIFLEHKKIFVRDYSHVNGMQDYVRITIGTVKQMKLVANEIKSFFNEKR